MENNLDNRKKSSEDDIPEAVNDKTGDTPAAKTIPWAIWIAIIVMIIVFLYMWNR
jgi:apolipoprotein N-acyltransferase